MNIKRILITLSLVGFSTAFGQELEVPKQTKHELGLTTRFRAGRLTPGLQYFYNVTPTQQLGAEFTMLYRRVGQNEHFINPSIDFSYRWKWALGKSFSYYIAPTLSYNAFNIGGGPISHQIGIGAKTGFEYDLSKKNVPLVIGAGFRSMVTYGAGRFSHSMTPDISIRFKF